MTPHAKIPENPSGVQKRIPGTAFFVRTPQIYPASTLISLLKRSKRLLYKEKIPFGNVFS
jgi:hypothetical protein